MMTNPHRSPAWKSGFRGLLLLSLLWLAPTLTWAGEKTVVSQTTETGDNAASPPNVSLLVHAAEPETLPAATELESDLLYRLRRQHRLFARVLTSGPTDDPGVADFLIDVHLVHLSPIDDPARRPLWLWLKRPIAERGTGPGERALHAEQVPICAEIVIREAANPARVRSRETLTVQSTGRTITAGTTKPPGILLADAIVHHLKRQRGRGVFAMR